MIFVRKKTAICSNSEVGLSKYMHLLMSRISNSQILENDNNKSKAYLKRMRHAHTSDSMSGKSGFYLNQELPYDNVYFYWAFDDNMLTTELMNKIRSKNITIFIFLNNNQRAKLSKFTNVIDMTYTSKRIGVFMDFYLDSSTRRMDEVALTNYIRRSFKFDKLN